MSARALTLALTVALGACSSSSSPLEDSSTAPPPATPPTPPRIDDITIPSWPPLGPSGAVEVRLSDDEALSRITATFNRVERRALTGTSGVVRFSGAELGEGMGTLTLVACDARSACRSRRVDNLLVDLSPPEIEAERAAVSPRIDGVEGQLAFWVADAWVLGSVSVTFKGKTISQDFPDAYPNSLGEGWDTSRVAIDAKDLAVGDGDAVVVARDAAGNGTTRTFRIRVDAVPPLASIVAPAAGATVKGAFDVSIAASDDGPTPPTVELWVGGARVLEASAPLGPITIDASTLPAGATELRAVARDEAGNRSTVATRTVHVAP